MLVEGYWNVGKLLREYNYNTKSLQDLAVDVGISERTLWYALQTYDKYKSSVPDLSRNLDVGERTIYRAIQAYDEFPKIDMLPEGKNITWNKLITKYLPEVNMPVKEFLVPQGKYSCIVVDPPMATTIYRPHRKTLTSRHTLSRNDHR